MELEAGDNFAADVVANVVNLRVLLKVGVDSQLEVAGSAATVFVVRLEDCDKFAENVVAIVANLVVLL